MLAATGCEARYPGDDTSVFQAVDLTVEAGELVTIVGRSGSGKSTFLLVLAGLLDPIDGSVALGGSPVDRGDPRVGLVLQHYGLFPWYTVSENVLLGLRIRKLGDERDRAERARAMLDRIGLGDKASRYPRELSGGEQQRVALARTLVLEPRLLLLDEPFSALDALTREALQDELLRLLDGRETAAVMVTHSLEEAVYLGDRVGILTGGAPSGGIGAADRTPGTLELRTNRAPPSVPVGGDRRGDPSYLGACVELRERFRETLRA